MSVVWIVSGRPDIGMTANGVLAGLVAITAGCRYVEHWSALVIGAVAGAVLVASVRLLDRWVDDPVGAVSVHGVCGMLGTALVGLFASERLVTEAGAGSPGLLDGGGTTQLGIQLAGTAAVALFVLGLAFAMFLLLQATVGLRVTPEAELRDLDLAEHGIIAYAPTAADPVRMWGGEEPPEPPRQSRRTWTGPPVRRRGGSSTGARR